MTAPRIPTAAALLFLVTIAFGTVHGQAADPQVTVKLDAAALNLGAANTTVVNGTITNGGTLQGTVTLVVTAPAAWSTTIEPATSFNLAAGASVPVKITLVAPAANTGDVKGNLVLTATLREQPAPPAPGTTRSAAGSATLTLTRIDPIIPPPPPPPYGKWALAAFGSLSIIGGVAYAEWRRVAATRTAERALAEQAAFIARETGITIRLLEGPRRFGLKRELIVRAEVKNVSERNRIALIDSVEIPDGWRVTSSLPRMELRPGETVAVSYHAEPSESVAAGSKASLVLRAKPEDAQVRDERVILNLDAPEILIPPANTKSVTGHREAITTPRPFLRY